MSNHEQPNAHGCSWLAHGYLLQFYSHLMVAHGWHFCCSWLLMVTHGYSWLEFEKKNFLYFFFEKKLSNREQP